MGRSRRQPGGAERAAARCAGGCTDGRVWHGAAGERPGLGSFERDACATGSGAPGSAHRADRHQARTRVHLPDGTRFRQRGRAGKAARTPMSERFSATRWWGIVRKEFLQLRRDRVTFAMIVGIPIIQMALFGFAINADPKHLPTAVIVADQSEFTRSFIAAMRNSQYFDIVTTLPDQESGRRALRQGKALFVLDIPAGFTRELVKGAHPSLLIEADATDATAVGTALGALPSIAQSALQKDLVGPLSRLEATPAPFYR